MVERFHDLCDAATVTWILVDADIDMLSPDLGAAGAFVVADHADVVSEVMARSFTADREAQAGPERAGATGPAARAGEQQTEAIDPVADAWVL